jgi:hypothetical protein
MLATIPHATYGPEDANSLDAFTHRGKVSLPRESGSRSKFMSKHNRQIWPAMGLNCRHALIWGQKSLLCGTCAHRIK